MQKQIGGSYSLEGLIRELENIPVPVSFSRESEASPESYLKKGERLMTLARDRFKKEIEKLSLSEYEKKLFSIPFPERNLFALVQAISQKVIRPMLKGEEEYAPEGEVMKFLRSVIDLDFSLIRVPDDDVRQYAACRYLSYRDKKNSDLLLLTLREEGEEYRIFGYRCYSHADSTNQRVMRKESSALGDIAKVLSWLIILCQYNRAVADPDMAEAVQDILSSAEGESTTSSLRKTVSDEVCNFNAAVSVRTGSGERRMLLPERIEKGCSAPFVYPQEEDRRLPEGALVDFCTMYGIRYDELREADYPEERIKARNRMRYMESGGTSPEVFLVTRDILPYLQAYTPVGAALNGYGKVTYKSLLDRSRPGVYFPLPGTRRQANFLVARIREVLPLVWDRKGDAVKSVLYYESLSKEHARSFQNKKESNFPQKTLREMEESRFNNWFGFVEIDELCDLEKVRTLCEEFSAFKETYLKGLVLKEVTLRFRRLGNHKAAGLYYPHLKCLCVDINNPSSFIHELGHCIDHEGAEGSTALSSQRWFYKIWAKYCNCFDRYMSSHPGEAAQLKGKYDRDYYRVKTEVFARCFEIYVVRVLGVENSICKPDEESFAYPKDEELDRMIREYFGRLFEKLGEDAAEGKDDSDELAVA